MLKIPIVNHSPHPLPEYHSAGASGLDLRAWLSEAVILQPFERLLIPTGIFIAIPQGYEGQVRPRSGIALKQGITLVNTPGTIDSDYRGELKIPIINLSTQTQTINNGDRIAQLVVAPVARLTWEPVSELATTERQQAGFGHTGIS
ncbi:MAG: dUTP diphosphatase [Chitinophagia bacterium]|nr:dUTP diphosphatase [Chitinophagia bacterium]